MDIAIGELIKSLCRLLGRFADKSLASTKADKETGVLVEYNRHQRNEVRFTLHTKDKITVSVVFDMKKLSREYINNMVSGIQSRLEAKRKERISSIIEIPNNKLIKVSTQ